MFGSAPLCSSNINSCKMCSCSPLSSYQTYHSKTSKPVRILSKLNTLTLYYPTKITQLLFSEIFLVFLSAFLCNSHYYQKRNFRHLVEYFVLSNFVAFYSFCIIGRNGSPGETAKQRNDPRRWKIFPNKILWFSLFVRLEAVLPGDTFFLLLSSNFMWFY